LRTLRIAFLDSWLQTTVEGSGTAKSISTLFLSAIADYV
jgi:hypothetical protein